MEIFDVFENQNGLIKMINLSFDVSATSVFECQLKKKCKKKKMMANSRGDLGFIPNSRINAPSKGFLGSTGHPSKKGVVNQQPRLIDDNTFKTELHSDQLSTKRVEYLESQERRMTATINETRSETNKLKEKDEKYAETVKNLQEEINSLKNNMKRQGYRLFNDIQTVYGKCGNTIIGITCGDKIDTTIQNYKNNPSSDQLEKLTLPEWIMLVYPMVPVKLSETHTQYLMKCKTVDPDTGQLELHWIIVYEDQDGVEKRYISEFSLNPH